MLNRTLQIFSDRLNEKAVSCYPALVIVDYMRCTAETTLGQRMRQRRESKGLTRRKIAIACDVTEGTVVNWEIDKHVPKLTPTQLSILLSLLDWSLSDMIEPIS
jgi:DNA-binding XRE family transcriptional regulator